MLRWPDLAHGPSRRSPTFHFLSSATRLIYVKVFGTIAFLLATTVVVMADVIPLPRARPVDVPGDPSTSAQKRSCRRVSHDLLKLPLLNLCHQTMRPISAITSKLTTGARGTDTRHWASAGAKHLCVLRSPGRLLSDSELPAFFARRQYNCAYKTCSLDSRPRHSHVVL